MTDRLLADIARRCTIQTTEQLPKYLRLMNAVEDAVSEGLLKPGDRLPTETELTRAVPFALGTVQKALGGLVSRGVLSRSRRNGTFVAEPARPLDDMSRFAFERPDG
ncbi:MAG: GntR family transcriptional regulator, partial [Rhodospirillaceae bacterium]